LDDIGDWMEHVRQIWATRLDRLDAHLHEMKRLNDEADKPKLEQEQQHA
jgi:hypothetical protein